MSGFGAAVGGSALNLLIENASGLAGTTEEYNERKRKDAIHDYKEMEREGIMSRVAGAKAAGLHPLAALGFQAGPSPTMPVGGEMKPFNYHKDEQTDEYMRASQIRLLNAQADEAEARAREANRAVANQPGHAPPTMPTDPANRIDGQPQGLKPGVKVKEDEVIAGIRGRTAGTHPSGTDLRLPDGSTWTIPSGKASEGLEDMDMAKYYLFWQLNKDRLMKFITQDTRLGDLSFRLRMAAQEDDAQKNASKELQRELAKSKARGWKPPRDPRSLNR